jgi:hypothetical protein
MQSRNRRISGLSSLFGAHQAVAKHSNEDDRSEQEAAKKAGLATAKKAAHGKAVTRSAP